jgi:VWFA-related protein
MRVLSALVVCSIAMTAGASVGQPAQPPGAFRAGVDAVTIEVTVVDSDGSPVPDLAAGDFQVSVEGQPRRVISAALVPSIGLHAHDRSPAAAPVSTNDGIGRGRLVVFVVDQATLTQSSIRHVAGAAGRLLSKLTPNDRSALIVMPVGAGVPFTADHARVLDVLGRTSGLLAGTPDARNMGLEEVRSIAAGDPGALAHVASRECPTETMSGAFGNDPSGGQRGSRGGRGLTIEDSSFNADDCRRRLEFEAKSQWHQLRNTSLSSMNSLEAALSALKRIEGQKTVILVSGGWPLDVRDTSSELGPLAVVANDAHVILHSVFAVGGDNSADRGTVSSTALVDQAARRWPLETLAGLTGGRAFRADAGAGSIFERLARELSAFYRIGVEQAPSDLDGKARPLKVHVTRRGASVRAPGRFVPSSYAERDLAARLDAALSAPLPSTGLGVRLASYVVSTPDSAATAKVLLVGDAFGLRPGAVSFQLLLQDLSGKAAASPVQEIGSAVSDRFPFSTSIAVEPGRYIVRAAVADCAGAVGSVDHVLDVQRVAVGPLTAGDLVLARVPAGGLVIDTVRTGERLALQIDLTGDPDLVSAADVLFEVASPDDGPALLSVEATRASGRSGGSANAIASLASLSPGPYIARAKITVSGTISAIRRPFVLADPAEAAPSAAR